MNVKTLMTILGLCATWVARGQDTLQLPAFSIVDSQAVSVDASFKQELSAVSEPSAMPKLSLDAILAQEAGLPLKSYGPGLLATPTFRGGDAHHTQVVWNGMQLNSPMLGTVDLATLPTLQFDAASVMSGVSSSLYVTGGMGSIIALEQQTDLHRQQARLRMGVGSFGHHQMAADLTSHVSEAKRPTALSFSVDLQSMANNYPYRNISVVPFREEVQSDASFHRSNVSLSLAHKLSKHVRLDVTYWLGLMQRNIPAPINVEHPSAFQSDRAHRGFVSLQRQRGKWRLTFRSMVEDNVNAYVDSRIGVDNVNRYTLYQNHLETSYSFTKHAAVFGRVGLNTMHARSQFYEGAKSANTMHILVVGKFAVLDERLKLNVGTRAEQFQSLQRVLPFGGVEAKPFPQIPVSAIASVSRTVRFPTLNELYWNPGGDPDLSPEDGFTAEYGLRVKDQSFHIEAVWYHSRYTSRIRWLPTGTYFSPVNIDEAEINGLDLQGSQTIKLGNHVVRWNLAYHYTDAVGRNNQEAFRSLSYVPAHAAAAGSSWQFSEVRIEMNYQLVGDRYITNDESAYMPAYHLVSMGLGYTHRLSDALFMYLTGGVQNVFDWQYQNMPWRAMPGRLFTFQLDLRWEP